MGWLGEVTGMGWRRPGTKHYIEQFLTLSVIPYHQTLLPLILIWTPYISQYLYAGNTALIQASATSGCKLWAVQVLLEKGADKEAKGKVGGGVMSWATA